MKMRPDGHDKQGAGPTAGQCVGHLDAVLEKRYGLFSWVILLFAVLYRAVLFLELRSSGFFDLVFVDNKAYLDISLKILDGDLPGPLLKSALWFIQFEAIGLRMGLGMEGLHLLQYLSGILTVLTVLALGRRVAGSTPALIGGAVLAVYGPLLFQESQLVAAGWAAFFFTLAVLAPLAFPGAPASVFLLSGLIMGLGIQSQANMIIAAAVFFIGLLIWKWREIRTALFLFPLGVCLALLPLTIHNLRSGELLPLSATGGINFFIGNGPQANGSFVLPEGYSLENSADMFGPSSLDYPEKVLGHRVSYSEASRFWTALTVKSMAKDPLRALILMGKKAALLIQAWEIPNNISYHFFKRVLVRLPILLDFGILFSLALPALFFTARAGERRPLLWAFGGYSVSVIIFFVIDRYRLALVPITALLAGVGLTEILSRWKSRGIRHVWPVCIPVLLALFLTHIPWWSAGNAEISLGWTNLGRQYYRDGSVGEAEEAFNKAIAADSSNEKALFSLASIHASREEWPKAQTLYRAVLEREPENPEALLALGRVLADSGDPEGALKIFLRGLEGDTENSLFYEDAADTALDMGMVNLASDILEKALAEGLRTSTLFLLMDRLRTKTEKTEQSP